MTKSDNTFVPVLSLPIRLFRKISLRDAPAVDYVRQEEDQVDGGENRREEGQFARERCIALFLCRVALLFSR